MTAAASQPPRDLPARTPLVRGGRRLLPALLLGLTLARRGVLQVASIAICITTAFGLALVAVVIASRGPQSPAHDVPLLASSALAWGGGFLLAFSAAAHALRRDRTEGIRGLFVARTTSLEGYLLGRIGGLALLIAILVAGGTLLCGLAAIGAASRAASVPRILQATAAGIVFAIAFAAVVAPVAFAALGARSRIGGYVFLVCVVSLPQLLVMAMGAALPESIADVLSIPSALGALRASLAPGTEDLYRAARAIVALALVVAFALFLVRRDAILVDQPEADA
jgi:hypothetical protein